MDLYINWKNKNYLDILPIELSNEDIIKVKNKFNSRKYINSMEFRFIDEDEVHLLFSNKPVLVSHKLALSIIENSKPLGLFYEKTDDVYIGIDNLTGDAWTEEFVSKRSCIEWLRGADLEECQKI